MIKIPPVKTDKYYVTEALIILGGSIVFLACLGILLYWYVFSFSTEQKKSNIENAYRHPYAYPKYQFENVLKSKLFGQPE
jgi:hypothetical protein